MRFGLRALFLALACASVVLGLWVNKARRQSVAVESLTRIQARVMFDYQRRSTGTFDPSQKSTPSDLLLNVFGEHYFYDVVWVDLDSPAVTNDSLKVLGSLPNLEVLHISNTLITNEGLASLKPLSHLRHLTVNSSDVNDTALLHIAKIPELQILEISGGTFSASGIEHLRDLRHLKILRLEDTNLTAANVRRIKELLPACEVEHWP